MQPTDKNAVLILGVFEGHNIRQVWHNNEWYFSVVDVVQALQGYNQRKQAQNYWNKLAQRLRAEGADETLTNWERLRLPSSDGKYYETICANTETMARIIQSIPSPKAEPFKQWLARVGTE